MFRCDTAQKALVGFANPAKQVLFVYLLQQPSTAKGSCHASLQEVQKMHRRLVVHVDGWWIVLCSIAAF